MVVAKWGLGGSAPLLVRFLGASEKMNESSPEPQDNNQPHHGDDNPKDPL